MKNGKLQRPELLKKLSDLEAKLISHGSGSKFVFKSNSEMPHASTQVAYGKFLPGEECEEHAHATMYEYFFFISGRGVYRIDGKSHELSPNTFLEIPAGVRHSLHASAEHELHFVYWGIATD